MLPLRVRAPRQLIAGSPFLWRTSQILGTDKLAIRFNASEASPRASALSAKDLFEASQLAQWSGLCYQPAHLIESAAKAEGLNLVAHGRDMYTSWIVADGHFTPLSQGGDSTGPSLNPATAGSKDEGGKAMSLGVESTNKSNIVTSAGLHSPQPSHLKPGTEFIGRTCRVVLLRGVQWNAPETSMSNMWRVLASAWPVPFAQNMSHERGGHLVCHAGIADVSLELFAQLAPYLRRNGSAASSGPLIFGGHSLGGSLAKLIWVLSILHGHRLPHQLACHNFGSPQVLSHNDGGGSSRVMQFLGASPGSCKNWIQEHDPVPRAMMASDPYFHAFFQNSALKGLLQARSWLLGTGSLVSSERFLFENVGDVYLIKGGCEILQVRQEDEVDVLHMALSEAVSQPHKTIQYWLDHHHGSYAHDLHIAATVATQRCARADEQVMAGVKL
ncbi:hypothetical protein CEUSTIGMA_g9161.t1 [Chlamydomonas eustigma]|uniref:Fungal lipase-type domain-containing protein n=1 Tax=Chlamydomonas eustigma TaxID=1157962 RepID=A0A250XFA7_9CHLO|nr:hypothetical protein CEUSTIGMA_g9161.t1 [Chlamydomonas eustigma]|eukprot:GAX81733.1 hypothetical protein CEUSTIGMA_g9161.t1 [Chlamydomonas eustigma]